MNLHSDKSGLIVLPKSVRQQLGLASDTALEDGVLVRRVADRTSVAQVGGLWVHQGTGSANTDWADIVNSVRNQRTNASWTP